MIKIGDVACHLVDVRIGLYDPVYPDGRFARVKIEFLVASEHVDKFQKWLRENEENLNMTTHGRSLGDRHPV